MRMDLNVVFASSVMALSAGVALADDTPRHAVPVSKAGDLVVSLCDGQTSLEVSGTKAGDTLTREQAQSVSDRLMRAWRQKHPGAWWDEAVAQNAPTPAAGGNVSDTSSHGAVPGTPKAGVSTPGASGGPILQHGIYSGFTNRDEEIWAASTQAFIDQGNKIFHDAAQLGGTIGVSCDMCHPNAANTHPETYPKYQVQLGRVALLRDMINWCIENPVRGKPLADGDPKMKALEAFILSQRKGVPLAYGKH